MTVKVEHRSAAPPRAGHERHALLLARNVLLASHDTVGSRAAELAALDAVAKGGRLHQLVIVPEFWQSITGDGWRINASTEHEFCNYVEATIEKEILTHLNRVSGEARLRGIEYSAGSKHGRLETCLIETARESDFDLVVIGAPRPRSSTGLRSRMNLDKLVRGLRVPLVVIPHPAGPASEA